MSAEIFRKRLVSSGLLSEGDLRVFLNGLPASERPTDAGGLARLLARSGKLTDYQAQQLMQAKTKGLVFGNYVVLDRIGEGPQVGRCDRPVLSGSQGGRSALPSQCRHSLRRG